MTAVSAGPARLMVVEDSLVNYQVLEAMLEILDHTIVNHTDSSDAVLDNARACLPDAILMDVALPGESGIDLTRALRQHPDTAHIKVIGVSAYADDTHRDEALAAGMCAFVTKPVDLDQLAAVLAEHVAGRG